MPTRKIYLSTLTAGRCFTAELDPAESQTTAPEEAGGQAGLRMGRPMMSPETAWRVVGADGDEILAENATGEQHRFAAADKVVEIPRQGFDRLAERARQQARDDA